MVQKQKIKEGGPKRKTQTRSQTSSGYKLYYYFDSFTGRKYLYSVGHMDLELLAFLFGACSLGHLENMEVP